MELLEEEKQAVSYKGEKRKSYTTQFKKEAILFAEETSIRKAAKRFKVEPKRIREWRDNSEKINGRDPKKTRLAGADRPLLDENVEEQLIQRIYERRRRMLRVFGKMVMVKAKSLYDENHKGDPTGQDAFVASRGWQDKFMKRSGLSFRRRTTTQEKDPALLIDKLVSYILYIRRLMKRHSFVPSNIYAMDEPPVWMDMIAPTTIAKVEEKDIPLKSSGHVKSRVTVCLTMKADGTKLNFRVQRGRLMLWMKSLTGAVE